jgi:hypothetical protein
MIGMYKALKSAQSEIQEVLLKFVDEFGKTPNCKCSNLPQAQMQVPVPVQETSHVNYEERLDMIERSMRFAYETQNTQFHTLITEIASLNKNMSRMVSILSDQAHATVNVVNPPVVQTATTIPNLQPTSEGSDLKDVCIMPSAIEASQVEEEVEEEADVEDEAEHDLEDDQVVADEDQVATPDLGEEDAEGIEVEEWTFKGRTYFKDTENTVYANEAGEIGDAIGVYDPVKNIVKKVPTN